MELGTLLQPGQLVRLKVNDSTAPYVVNMCHNSKLIVCKAVKQPIPVTPDTFRVFIIKDSESGLFIIKAHLKESSERGAVIALTNLSEPRFVQRREHYRLSHGEISVPLDIELRPQNNVNRYKRLKLHDISAGGIGLIVKASSAFTVGTHVNLTMNLDRSGSITAIGEIVHITSFNANARDFLVGIKYIQIDKASLDALMSFIQEQVDFEHKENPAEADAESAGLFCDDETG
ncbi:MAG: PilZ domain-containing protein [Candidatus Aquicultor sp.]|nr:PilZ domain-containing protein [Candidatus Aquicultor sp.]